jgi:hypothetical protein
VSRLTDAQDDVARARTDHEKAVKAKAEERAKRAAGSIHRYDWAHEWEQGAWEWLMACEASLKREHEAHELQQAAERRRWDIDWTRETDIAEQREREQYAWQLEQDGDR